MTSIPGASQFLNSATLANQQGLGAGQATVLGDGGIGSVSLLDVGRSSLFDSGVGLSARARQLNNDFINSTASTFNQIFSLGIGATASIEGLQQQILALRANTPDSQLSRDLQQDNGEAAASENGQEVDTTA